MKKIKKTVKYRNFSYSVGTKVFLNKDFTDSKSISKGLLGIWEISNCSEGSFVVTASKQKLCKRFHLDWLDPIGCTEGIKLLMYDFINEKQ